MRKSRRNHILNIVLFVRTLARQPQAGCRPFRAVKSWGTRNPGRRYALPWAITLRPDGAKKGMFMRPPFFANKELPR
jgi:hypothetical protein